MVDTSQAEGVIPQLTSWRLTRRGQIVRSRESFGEDVPMEGLSKSNPEVSSPANQVDGEPIALRDWVKRGL